MQYCKQYLGTKYYSTEKLLQCLQYCGINNPVWVSVNWPAVSWDHKNSAELNLNTKLFPFKNKMGPAVCGTWDIMAALVT